MNRTVGAVVLVVAVAAAVASGLYLTRAQKTVELATKPVAVSAPDLFPADTLAFAAVHHVDETWGAVEEFWKKVEPTASWYLAKKQWDEARE